MPGDEDTRSHLTTAPRRARTDPHAHGALGFLARIGCAIGSAIGCAVGSGAGCATTEGELRSTWEEASSVRAREGRLTDPLSPAPRSDPREAPGPLRQCRARESLPNVDFDLVELALLRFMGERNKISARNNPRSPSHRWPAEMNALWANLFGVLEGALSSTCGDVPRRLLIQARVSTEVELQLTERRFGEAPRWVRDRLRRAYGEIARHMRASQPPRQRRPASGHAIMLEWPVQPVLLTSPFGYRNDPILDSIRFHRGIDLAAEAGDLVTAAGAGRVESAGWSGGHGRMVVVQHARGYRTLYAHMNRIVVRKGDQVSVGSPIGFVGDSGRTTGPHLHFEVRLGGLSIDPAEVVGEFQEVSLGPPEIRVGSAMR